MGSSWTLGCDFGFMVGSATEIKLFFARGGKGRSVLLG